MSTLGGAGRAMRVSAWALAALAVASVASCAQPHALEWLLEYDREPPLLAAHLLEIRADGCTDTGRAPLYRAELRRFDDAPMDVPPLGAGTYGFYAEARDEDCMVLATGCTVVTLPSADATVVTTLTTSTTGEARCDAARCSRGVCVGSTDAGAADAGTIDAPARDGGADAPALDAHIAPDAYDPDVWAPDAFTVPDACDSTRAEVCNGLDDNCNAAIDETFDLATDALNCGSCGTVCPAGSNATPACRARACAFDCRPLFADCNGGADGCETSLMDVSTCGACGTACSGATPVCGTGPGGTPACVTGCSGAEVRCGGTCTNTNTDPLHCGACMRACTLPHATAGCSLGTCTVASCDPGWANCNGIASDGCEADIFNNPSRCGSCTNVCNLTRAVEGCSMGTCTVASCDAGYGDCDGTAANGCEVNLNTDVAHCGMCPNACPTCHSCSSGVCTPQSDLSSCSGGRCVALACCTGCTAAVASVQMCYPGNVDTACGRAGASCTACGRCQTCVGGACTSVPNGTACSGAGPAGLCYGGSCCSGCWDGAVCRAGSTDAQCGVGGIACTDCPCFCGTTQMCDVGVFRLIDTGHQHSCVVYRDTGGDFLYCWGDNSAGQLGIGSVGGTSTPRPVMSASTFNSMPGSLGLGELHTVAQGLGSDTHSWGSNALAQLGTGAMGAPVASPMEISTSGRTIRAGAGHTCWSTSSITFQCWGRNDQGQVGNGMTSPFVAAATTVSGLGGSGTNSFALGDAHTCFVNGMRQLFCWGANGSGQLGVGSAMTPITSATREGTSATNWAQVDAGGSHTCARTTTNQLFCWGENGAGQLGTGGGADADMPVQVGMDNTWTSVSTGGSHTCGIRAGGQLWCWGANASGQLGDGSTMPRDTPVRVGSDSDWTEVSAGASHTCAIRTNGVYCWGSNASGQLGVSGGNASSPQRVCGFL